MFTPLSSKNATNNLRKPFIKEVCNSIVDESIIEKLCSIGIDINSMEECSRLIDCMPLQGLTSNKRVKNIIDNTKELRIKRNKTIGLDVSNLGSALLYGFEAWELIKESERRRGLSGSVWALPYFQKRILIFAWLQSVIYDRLFTRSQVYRLVNPKGKGLKIISKSFNYLLLHSLIESVSNGIKINNITKKFQPLGIEGKRGRPITYYMITRQGNELLQGLFVEILKQVNLKIDPFFDNELLTKIQLPGLNFKK